MRRVTKRQLNLGDLDLDSVLDYCLGLKKPENYTRKDKMEMLARKIEKAGRPPINPASVKKWFERGNIPGDRLVDLHIVAARQGRKLSLLDHIAGYDLGLL